MLHIINALTIMLQFGSSYPTSKELIMISLEMLSQFNNDRAMLVFRTL